MSPHRLASGGRIDRTRPIAFTVDGVERYGCAGDTLASALLANGVWLMGRSFKRHRPRGPLGSGVEEPNALFRVGAGNRAEPNTQATRVGLYDGLVAESQNHWPSLHLDALALIDRCAGLFPAGFYYKTFKSPAFAWRFYEAIIRRLAGLGAPPKTPDPDDYSERFAHVDLLVVGLGPAGIAAARAGVEAGLRVMAVEQDRDATTDFAQTAIASLRTMGVRVVMRATAFGLYDHELAGVVERLVEPGQPPAEGALAQRLWKVQAKEIVLATGAIERPLTFADNDRPGVMLASAAADYCERHAVAVGRQAVLAVACDAGYESALRLAKAGAPPKLLLDLRPAAAIGSDAREASRRIGLDVIPDVTLTKAHGRDAISAVSFEVEGRSQRLECDALLVCGGWTPTIHLHAHARGGLSYEPSIGAFLPSPDDRPIQSAGACAGVFGLRECWEDGWTKGARAAQRLGRSAPPAPAVEHDGATFSRAALRKSLPKQGAKSAFVDFQNDVTVADIALAEREGYSAVEHAKRYTTLGMGADQGKTSGVIGLHALADMRSASPADVGITTYRPPFTPVTLSALAGGRTGGALEPTRRSPVFDRLEQAGAEFQTSGLWLRPRYFPRDSETLAAAAHREAQAVRTKVGLTDASTLGKIDVSGPDAATFLDRLYATNVGKIPVGRVRYAVMLNDDGFVYDDGTIQRWAEDRFLVTTSTIRAEAVIRRFEFFRDVLSGDLDVDLADVTEAWATLVIAGPQSVEVLAQTLSVALAPQALTTVTWRGHELRVARVSYSGERAFEIYAPIAAADSLWDALWADVEAREGTLYGLEALDWLRIEKGHIAVGAEIDGRTTAADLGLARWIKKKGDHAGAVGATRKSIAASDRPELVGLIAETMDPIAEGAAIVTADGKGVGHVTSAAFGVGVGRPIALGLLQDASGRQGSKMEAWSPTRGRRVVVRVGPPCAYDPEGARLGDF